MFLRLAKAACASLLLAAGWVGGCTAVGTEPTGGETHFLRRCVSGVDSCGPELTCLDAVCTIPCDSDTVCDELPGAECRAIGASAGTSEAPRCEATCQNDTDCAVISSSHRCEQGLCRGPSEASSSGLGGASTGPTSSQDECVLDGVSGNEVLVLGDSFFATTHQITAFLEGLARAAGRLPTGERFRDASNLTENTLALGGNGIAAQYTTAASEAPARIVIMNGGGADVLLGSCDTVDTSCPLISSAASAAEELFSTLATDGVSLVVYAFYPDPVSEDVREKVDVLRPLAQVACEESAVPCLWVDLREIFAGKYDEYVAEDGLNPTSAGSSATAEAIWARLESFCTE